jgi:DNA replication protein DnaC
MLKILDLPLGFSDAENYKRRENKNLLTQIFVRTDSLERICDPSTTFVIGEKGTGKTAYAVYIMNTAYREQRASLRYIRETDYQKFVTLKREHHLDFTSAPAVPPIPLYLNRSTCAEVP